MRKITFLNVLFFSFCAILINSTAMAQTDSVWLEAECGTVGSRWNTVQDDDASLKHYVTFEVESTNGSKPTDDGDVKDQLIYTFNVNDGDYILWLRHFAATAGDDSIHFRLDDGAWKEWNGIGGTTRGTWSWDSKATNTNLTAGEHKLYINFREDGFKIDKILLTKTADVPADLGDAVASACTPVATPVLSVKDQTNEVAEILMYPNPVSDVLSIYLPGKENKSTTLSVYNTNGSLVKTITAENGDNKIDIKKLTNGLYFIVFNINNKVYNRKFVKN